MDRQKGRAEGKAEDILEFLQELGTVPQELRERIMGEKDITLLSHWVKLAARAGSVEEFCAKAFE